MLLQDEVARLFQTLFEIRYEPCTVYKYVFRLNDKFIVANYRLSFYEDQTYDYFYHMIVYQMNVYSIKNLSYSLDSCIIIFWPTIITFTIYLLFITLVLLFWCKIWHCDAYLITKWEIFCSKQCLLYQCEPRMFWIQNVEFVVTKCSFHIKIIRLYNRGAKMYDYFILWLYRRKLHCCMNCKQTPDNMMDKPAMFIKHGHFSNRIK